MTNTSAALQLPPELLGTVFRLIRSTSKAAVANRDLAAFALVCRNWHVPATVELYRIFEIKAATGCWPSEEKRFDELTSSSKAELVQVVALRCRGRWDSTNERFWWAEKLPQVRHVELLELAGRDEPAVESLARSVVGLADCLVSLTINGACTKPTQILLTQLPTLTSFTQLGAPSTHGFFLHADLPPPPFRLQQHSLRNAWAPEYLDWLIRNSHTSLSALSLAPFPDAFHPALDLSRSPNLSHLSLPVDIMFLPTLISVLATASASSRLRNLRLDRPLKPRKKPPPHLSYLSPTLFRQASRSSSSGTISSVSRMSSTPSTRAGCPHPCGFSAWDARGLTTGLTTRMRRGSGRCSG